MQQYGPITQIDQQEKVGNPSPIFIVGLPRSGTTLVEQIISSDPGIYGAGELEFLANAIRKSNTLTDHTVTPEAFLSIANAYLNDARSLKGDLFTDKLPLNFRWLGYIEQLFPNAKILHVHRDPVATCWSIYTHFFSSPGNAFGNNLTDLVNYYQMYTDLMSFWEKNFSDKIKHILYEELTESPAAVSEEVFGFLGRSFENSYLDSSISDRAVRTASSRQVRQTLYKNSSQEWKVYSPYLGRIPDKLKEIKKNSFLNN